jgi:AraC-like DNA-binding protein
MFPTRHEILTAFRNPELIQHPNHPPGVRTFSCLRDWNSRVVVELPKLHIDISAVDYLSYAAPDSPDRRPPLQLHFQQDCFRLWFQVEGTGILHNLSRNSFGTARPGLLGIMERSQRYSYLHQKGAFECFQVFFSLLPSKNARCYWNSTIEGKCVLEGNERAYFENLVFDLLCVRSNNKEVWGLAATSRLLEIFVVLFNKGLLVIEEEQFPKNKTKSLVAKATMFMELNYARMRHQRELEKECGVDINYLNIIFKKETGRTLYDFLTGIRMEQAKYLLETTAEPVTEIASRVGYPAGNSFTRAFTRLEKCPPLDFRRKFRERHEVRPIN